MVQPFELRGSGALHWLRVRRRWVTVGLGEGALYVALRPDRVLTFPVDRIRRILVGREPYRFATGHRLEIWPGEGRSIILTAFEGHAEMPGYMALVRGLAIDLERRGALDRMRIGLPRLYALGIPVLVFVCLYGSIWFATWAEGRAPATLQEHLPMALAILALALLPAGWNIRQGFQRRVRALADLDRFLGGAVKGGGAMAETSDRWLILAASWLAIVVVLIMLAQAADAGPLAWFDSWLAVHGGQLRGLQLSMLVLMLPAAYLLGAAIRRAIRLEARTPAMRRQFLGIAMALGALGLLCLAVAAAAYLRYMEATDAAANPDPATELSPGAALAEAARARQRVALTGAPIERREIRFVWRGRGFSTYTGFRPGGMRRDTMEEGPGSPPVAIFIERVGYRSGPGTPIEHRPHQDRIEGYLVENGLPDHARAVLTREGVRIAEPHYLFRADRDGPAQQHLTTALAVGFNGGLLLCFALWLTLKGRLQTGRFADGNVIR